MISMTEEEILSLKPVKNGLSGQFGGVRYIDNNTLIKMVYNTPKAKQHLRIIKSRINNMLGIKVEDVSFPFDTTSLEYNNFFAYTMPYIIGDNYYDVLEKIKSGQMNLSFDDLSINYHNGQKKIFEITSKDILIWDLKPDNCCLMDNLKIGIYDVDFFKKVSCDPEKILNNNEWFLNYMYEVFFNDVLELLNIPIRHLVTDKNKTIIMENYIDNLLDEIVKRTSSNTKTLGEILRK